MSLSLSNLKSSPGSRTSSKRVGRGGGSGKGTTAGRGTKGQRARTGGRNKLKRLGMRHIILSTPKLGGFRSIYKRPAIVSVGVLNNIFENGSEITPKKILSMQLVDSASDGVKILGDGAVTKKFTIKDCTISESAKKKIVEAGGNVNE